jgi:methyl-accepting chemotaxis protein
MGAPSFRKSLLTLAAIAGIGMLLATVGGLWQAYSAASVAAHIYEARTAPTIDLMKAVDALHRARQTILIALSEEKEAAAAAQLKSMAGFDETMNSALQAYVAAVPDQRESIDRLKGLIAEYGKARDQSVKMIAVGDLPSALENIKSNAGPKFDKVLASLSEVIQTQAHLAQSDYQRAAGSLRTRGLTLLVLALATLAGLAYLFYRIGTAIMRQLGGEPAVAVNVARAIAHGRLDNAIELRADDQGSLLADMKSMQAQLRDRIDTDRRTAEENLRIRIALDNVSTGVMIADAQRSIIYTNKSVSRILRATDIAGFDADRLLGQTGEQPVTADLSLDGRRMTVTANPVINDQGERLGVVTEWFDRTAEVKIEAEVAEIVQAASFGVLDTRIDMAGKEGFIAKLGAEINGLLDNTQRSLEATSAVLDALAHGDLTCVVEGEYHGTFGQLKDDANMTVERLRSVVGRIKSATDAINTAAREIAAGNQDLSRRTEAQASSLDQTASSMEQINVTVKQNAENARQANELACASNEDANRGGEMMLRLVATMDSIQESSKKIADIIGVIDSIAFQTNILALNAAVEAARAGDQGRGFAVVASEVRNLAQRSATAAKEIKALITDSVAKVENGAALVGDARGTIDKVVSSFHRVVMLLNEISNASREQSAGIGQVTQAVGRMDEATQQNSSLVEEAAAAAASLEEQTRGLAQTVGGFKLAAAGTALTPSLRTVVADRPRAVSGGKSAARLAVPSRSGAAEEWGEF